MKLNLNRPLIFFDLETTGVNVGSDRIVEISMVKVVPDGTHDTKTLRVNPTIPIPAKATEVHGITDEDVRNEPTFAQLAHGILQFIGNADLAGYNSNKFDVPLLAEEFLRAGVDFDLKGRRCIDVLNIYNKMEPRTLSAALMYYCGKEMEHAHSAENDAMATYGILLAQLEKYSGMPYHDKNGQESYPVVNDVAALHEFSFLNRNVDLAGHLIYDENGVEVFNFGKHKGVSVEKIFKTEPSYYDWMMKAEFPLYTKKVITAIKLRGFNRESVKLQ
jgi:DNA polymerase-3 subunit epsilon